jgi:hypothetical protein
MPIWQNINMRFDIIKIMKGKAYIIVLFAMALMAFVLAYFFLVRDFSLAEENVQFTDYEAGFENVSELDEPSDSSRIILDYPPAPQNFQSIGRQERWAYFWKELTADEKAYYANKKRPVGPVRVGIQVGHWKNNEVPDELLGLKRNGGGAIGGGKIEVDVVLEISSKVKSLLENEGVVVDLLPATIPPDYLADAFVSIHADGSTNTSVSGFKIASPHRDFSGKSVSLMDNIYDTYSKETSLKTDGNITRRMSAYYAFNWRRYEYALSPMTPAVIVETGFLTSSLDRKIIVENQDKSARGIAKGILNFLSDNSLM